MTPLTPPLGFGVPPSLLGIRWIWACKMVCPADPPQFTPILKPVTDESDRLIWFRMIAGGRPHLFSLGMSSKKSRQHARMG